MIEEKSSTQQASDSKKKANKSTKEILELSKLWCAADKEVRQKFLPRFREMAGVEVTDIKGRKISVRDPNMSAYRSKHVSSEFNAVR